MKSRIKNRGVFVMVLLVFTFSIGSPGEQLVLESQYLKEDTLTVCIRNAGDTAVTISEEYRNGSLISSSLDRKIESGSVECFELTGTYEADDEVMLVTQEGTQIKFIVKPGQIDMTPPSDEDGDGIPDFNDKCSNPDCDIVDSRGCPKDSDEDGINDCEDECPSEYGEEDNGCPVTPTSTPATPTSTPPTTPPSTSPPSPGYPTTYLVLLLIAVIVIAVGVLTLKRKKKQEKKPQVLICPKCKNRIQEDWDTCPYCKMKLK